jgi:hypothetical protein
MAGLHSLTRRARAAMRRWLPTVPLVARRALRRTVWRDPPIELVGIPVDPESVREHVAWCRQMIEYINGHEEIGFYLQERRFHICRRHARARRVIATGVIEAGFACPRGEATCPFAAAAACAPGHAVALVPLRPRQRTARAWTKP